MEISAVPGGRELPLRDTHAPLAEIASACGFTDSPHLSRCFLESAGMTPENYRRRLEHSR